MKKNEFDPSAKYRFTRPMLWHGKYVATGDAVPDDGTPVGILRALFKQRQIEAVVLVTIQNKSNEPVTVSQKDDKITISAGPVAEIRSEGDGFYNVYMSGMPLTPAKIRGKKAVEKWCEEQKLTYKYS